MGIFQVGVILGGNFLLVGVFQVGIVWEGIIPVEVFLVPKESPRVTFERTKRVSEPEFTNKDLQIKMIMSYLEINTSFTSKLT